MLYDGLKFNYDLTFLFGNSGVVDEFFLVQFESAYCNSQNNITLFLESSPLQKNIFVFLIYVRLVCIELARLLPYLNKGMQGFADS